jgi:predicted nucleotidyltransferase
MAPMSLDTLHARLEQVPSVRLAVLFGSEAQGTARRSSDIDLGLILDERGPDVASLVVDLERALARTVHVVLLDEAPPLLRSEIGRYGKVLVERRPYEWADFRAHAMIDWWDWAPTAAMIERSVAARLREETGHGAA